MKRLLRFVARIFFLLPAFLSGVLFVSAQSVSYTPLASIPGVVEGSGTTLTSYLSGFFYLGLGIATVLAVVMIVFAGVEMMASAGNESVRSRAKDRIKNAIFGLLLALFSWLIVFTVNPQILGVLSSGFSLTPAQSIPNSIGGGGISPWSLSSGGGSWGGATTTAVNGGLPVFTPPSSSGSGFSGYSDGNSLEQDQAQDLLNKILSDPGSLVRDQITIDDTNDATLIQTCEEKQQTTGPCEKADLNKDGSVTQADYSELLNQTAKFDLNNDKIVDPLITQQIYNCYLHDGSFNLYGDDSDGNVISAFSIPSPAVGFSFQKTAGQPQPDIDPVGTWWNYMSATTTAQSGSTAAAVYSHQPCFRDVYGPNPVITKDEVNLMKEALQTATLGTPDGDQYYLDLNQLSRIIGGCFVNQASLAYISSLYQSRNVKGNPTPPEVIFYYGYLGKQGYWPDIASSSVEVSPNGTFLSLPIGADVNQVMNCPISPFLPIVGTGLINSHEESYTDFENDLLSQNGIPLQILGAMFYAMMVQADLNHDGIVDLRSSTLTKPISDNEDLNDFNACVDKVPMQPECAQADFNKDGRVSRSDLGLIDRLVLAWDALDDQTSVDKFVPDITTQQDFDVLVWDADQFDSDGEIVQYCMGKQHWGGCYYVDFNGDGKIDAKDQQLFNAAMAYDINDDGVVSYQGGLLQLSSSSDTIQNNQTVKVTWNTSYANTCTASSTPAGIWSGQKNVTGAEDVGPLSATNTTKNGTILLGLDCANTRTDKLISGTVTVRVVDASPLPFTSSSVNVTASPPQIAPGETSQLSWYAIGADSCTASGAWSGVVALNGQMTTPKLYNDTIYLLTCTKGSDSITASTTVTVAARSPVTITATPADVSYNGSTKITWTATNAGKGSNVCTASGDWSGSYGAAGQATFDGLTANKSYTITCSGVSATATVTVQAAPSQTFSADTLSIAAYPSSVAKGGTATISWSAPGATSCVGTDGASGWSGLRSSSGSLPFALNTTTTFTISCSDGTTNASKGVMVNVGGGPTFSASTFSFGAVPTTIQALDAGSIVTFNWNAPGATTCVGTNGENGWGGLKSTSGTQGIAVDTTTTFGLSCSDGTTNLTKTVVITVL